MLGSTAIVGGGPAGLYLAYRLMRRAPASNVTVFEQNPHNATFGFGVVFSDQAMAFLAADDPATAAAIAPHMETWTDMQLNLKGCPIKLDGVGFSAIGRMELLHILQGRARDAGAELRFEKGIESLDDLKTYDLIVGADGLNSVVRRSDEAEFGTSLSYFDNKFAWFGATCAFDTLTQSFVETEWGPFNAHHYRYAPDRSTFIVECARETWVCADLAKMNEDASRKRCETIFADVLDGAALIANKSQWRSFPILRNKRWSFGNRVLVGDALHTAHFSIGSGTRLALEDAIALDRALADYPDDLAEALHAYQEKREPTLSKIVNAANTSAAWYEEFGERMSLDPIDFGYDYITRSGRITPERLRRIAPGFAAQYEAERPAAVADPVGDDVPGAREIGFDKPDHANASAILFDNLTKGYAEKTAVTGPCGSFSFAQICGMASQYGHALRQFGLKRGERVILFLDDTPSCVAAFFGALRAGFVPVVLNTLSPPELVQFYLHDSGARIAICDADFNSAFSNAAVRETELELVVIANGAGETATQTVLESEFLNNHPETLRAAPTRPDDMAFWLYSSGTTGRPKGVVHLHHDMAYTAQSYGDSVLKLGPDDICYSVPKVFFAYGLGNTLTFPFSRGAACVLVPGQPRPETVLGAIHTHKPSVFFGLPTLYTALGRSPQASITDFSSLRLSISAAETLSESIFNRWKELTGLEIVEGLGSTELLHIYLSNRPDRKRLGAAGMRVPGYEVELRDSEGRVLGDGEEGVLFARGQSSAPIYWDRPVRTAETMVGDWLNTGDRFVRDSDGFYFFRGRADDLIKISGQWVHPLEVEQCMQRHPIIAECAVFAHELDDKRMTLRACVALRDGVPTTPDDVTNDIQAFVKQALLPHKYPRIVEYLDELPKTGTGKIDRQALKTRADSSVD